MEEWNNELFSELKVFDSAINFYYSNLATEFTTHIVLLFIYLSNFTACVDLINSSCPTQNFWEVFVAQKTGEGCKRMVLGTKKFMKLTPGLVKKPGLGLLLFKTENPFFDKIL